MSARGRLRLPRRTSHWHTHNFTGLATVGPGEWRKHEFTDLASVVLGANTTSKA